MTTTLVHRGPDAGGVWSDAEAGVALGHRRLSILDLSPAGEQPMVADGGRYVVVFNGEIYNFQELRKELDETTQGPRYAFRGNSDTEVLLAAVRAWGLETALRRFNGMFAFALWDRETRMLHLARDRLGKKPLYYGWCGNTLLFGSELKALRAHPDFRAEISRDALGQFMRFGYVPAPYSIYRGIAKLPPACYLSIDPRSPKMAMPQAFWTMAEVAHRGLEKPFPGSASEALLEMEHLLVDAVRIRMVADVPLGAFLSGGIDSSLVVALMQSQSSSAVKTFTIGFGEAGFNEAPHAKAVADHLHTNHTELYVDAATALETIPRLPLMYDEPLADPSQIPTFLVSELTRRHVTVSLSGDGGDEFFCGYDRYRTCYGFWQQTRRLPAMLRTILSHLALSVPPNTWRQIVQMCGPLLKGRLDVESSGETLHRVARMMACHELRPFYAEFVKLAAQPLEDVLQAHGLPTAYDRDDYLLGTTDMMSQMMYLDSVSYLPDDVLTKVDRASMAVSLEVRNPLLDYRVIERAWSLPQAFKFHEGQGKQLLRRMLYKYVPQSIIDRPKMGFGVPITTWLRGPLRDWAEDLISERRLRDEQVFAVDRVRQRWQAHLSGKQDWGYYLWNVLMFQAWLTEHQRNTQTGTPSFALSA